MPTYQHTYIEPYLHTFIPTYIHTYLPTYIHTYINTYRHNVVSCLVFRFTIVANIFKIFQGPSNVWKVHYCGKNSWETMFFVQTMFVQKKLIRNIFFMKNKCLSPCHKRTRPLIKPLLKNSFSRNFQGTGPWEGPVHQFVLRVHNCSKLFQSWSWNQEKKEQPFTKTIEKFNAQAFPKRIRPLIKPVLKNSFSTHFQGTGPWEGPVHFSRFVLRVHNCSKLFQGWSWSQEKKEQPFTKAIEKFNAQAFPKRIRPLIKPVLKNSFSTNFQGTGPWEGPVHFSRFVLRVHSCSKLFQSWSWSQEKKEQHFTYVFLFLFIFLFLFLFLFFFLFLFLFLFLFSFPFPFPSSSSSSSSSPSLSLSLSFSFSFSLSLSLFLSLFVLWINKLRWNR